MSYQPPIYLHVNKSYLSCWTLLTTTVRRLISWKHSFRILNEEFEVARKKKEALDALLSKGRISQPTYDTFNGEINEAIIDIERQQRALRGKMTVKTEQLEAQIRTLETLLANSEIQHVTGEVDEEVYQRQLDLLSTGLENSRQELDVVKDAISQLETGDPALEERTEKEALKPEVEFPEMPVAHPEDESAQTPVEPVEAIPQESQTTERKEEPQAQS